MQKHVSGQTNQGSNQADTLVWSLDTIEETLTQHHQVCLHPL